MQPISLYREQFCKQTGLRRKSQALTLAYCCPCSQITSVSDKGERRIELQRKKLKQITYIISQLLIDTQLFDETEMVQFLNVKSESFRGKK